MRQTMRSTLPSLPVPPALRGTLRGTLLCALAATGLVLPLASASAASAATPTTAAAPAASATPAVTQLAGDWAPFTRCPVDDPALIAADGAGTAADCVASSSPGGSIKLGSLSMPIGATDLQFGAVESTATGDFSTAAPAGGALLAAPAEVPGGLLGLMCPSGIPVVSAVCAEITDTELNRITATVESVGAPSAFSLPAGLSTGKPIVSLPVRIHLENPLLGSGCYLGSAAAPIVLHPQNLTAPVGGFQRFDPDGTPDAGNGVLGRFALTGGTQGDSSYSVPGATGCGLGGVLDFAVDLKSGLPSASGANTLTLDDASTYLAGLYSPVSAAPDDGADLFRYWHSAAAAG